MPKQHEYETIVQDRKRCRLCAGLVNPAAFEDGRFDSDHVGPWSLWQGAIDARIMVIGQDWGDTRYFEANRGREAASTRTNQVLRQLLASIGVMVSAPGDKAQPQVAFFTNAILCLKDGGLQGPVQPAWFDNCGSLLRRQVETIAPRVVVTLGESAFRSLMKAFGARPGAFRTAVECADGVPLPNGSVLVPVYHCGARILNTHRPLEQQFKDWERVGRVLSGSSP